MGALVLSILVIATFGAGCLIRKRLGKAIDHGFTLKLSAISAGIGSSCIGAIFPLGYTLFSRAMHGGTTAANLPQGISEDAVLGLAVLGAVVIALGAICGLADFLRS